MQQEMLVGFFCLFSSHQLKTWQEDRKPEESLQGNQVGQHVHLWLTGVTNYEKIDFLCLSYSEYQILLQRLEQTNNNEYVKTLHPSVSLQMSFLFTAE